MNPLIVLAIIALVTLGGGLLPTVVKPVAKKNPERVLLFGDSFAQGLMGPMEQAARQAGSEFRARGEKSTRIDSWSKSEGLRKLLTDFQPTLVFISLGTNDEQMGPGVVERQRQALEELLTLVTSAPGFRELVWIGPPELNRPSNGVIPMLQERLAQYFYSEKLDIPRAADGLHPTSAGYKLWADAVWAGQ